MCMSIFKQVYNTALFEINKLIKQKLQNLYFTEMLIFLTGPFFNSNSKANKFE